jgi:hypothetical protein
MLEKDVFTTSVRGSLNALNPLFINALPERKSAARLENQSFEI